MPGVFVVTGVLVRRYVEPGFTLRTIPVSAVVVPDMAVMGVIVADDCGPKKVRWR